MLSTLTDYINGQFGSKKGLLSSIKYKFLMSLGFYSQYKQIDFSRVKRLIFVCSGNICRSPYAEFVAIYNGVNAESYGLHCRGGDPADPRAIDFAQKMGLSMDGHITRNIKSYKSKPTDLIVVMEPAHLKELDSDISKGAQVTVATLWVERANPYLHDPFSSHLTYFHRCETLLNESVMQIKKRLQTDTGLVSE